MKRKNCSACRHSYREPDSDLICGHPDLDVFGKTIRKEPLDHCNWEKFSQHPLRNSDGTQKKLGSKLNKEPSIGELREALRRIRDHGDELGIDWCVKIACITLGE